MPTSKERDRINAAFVLQTNLDEYKDIIDYIEDILTSTRIIYKRNGLPHEKLFIHKVGDCVPNERGQGP